MQNEREFRIDAVLKVAQAMCLAAHTAPKARGLDLLELLVLSGEDIQTLSTKKKEIEERESHPTI